MSCVTWSLLQSHPEEGSAEPRSCPQRSERVGMFHPSQVGRGALTSDESSASPYYPGRLRPHSPVPAGRPRECPIVLSRQSESLVLNAPLTHTQVQALS
jgi:hypothetical protein